jgi:hypothetical protein
MTEIYAAIIGFACGAGVVGLWWFWISRKAQIRATVQEVKDLGKKAP